MPTEESIKRKAKKLSKLHQFKTLTEEQLIKIVEDKTYNAHLDAFTDFLTDPKEKKLAKKLLSLYLKDYEANTVSDKNMLQQLVYLEIVQVRMQDEMNKVHKEDNAIPLNMLEALQTNLSTIEKLKEQLGLIKADKDDRNAFDVLKDKFKRWRHENQGSRSMVCPHCSKMIMLKIRPEIWEAQAHPFFKDRLLTNEHLITLLKSNTITREDVSKILGTSTDYVDWMLSKLSAPVKDSLEESSPTQ